MDDAPHARRAGAASSQRAARCAALVSLLLAACAEPSGPPMRDAEARDAEARDAEVRNAEVRNAEVCNAEAPLTYPPGPYAIEVDGTLPDLTFEGVDEDGAPASIALRDYYAPDDPAPDFHAPERRELLMVVVSGGLWCGTCRWPAQHAGELLDADAAARTRRLDLVIGDRDNAPADARAAAGWQRTIEGARVAVGADPQYRLGSLLDGPRTALPLFVLVDAATMRVVEALSNPAPAELRVHVHRALAALDGEEPEPAPEPALVDGFFHENEWELLRATTLPGAPPPDPTNSAADSPEAAALGRALFADAALSPSGTVACATCHRLDRSLSDGLARARGMREGDRRTPSIALAAHARWQFWDGRADSLWAQALGPFESPAEMGSSRVFVVRRVLSAYLDAYRAAFGDAPSPDGWPAEGMPGDPAYDALPAAERDAITRVFVNTGKAIAAFERTFRVEANPLDRYLAGDLDALDPEQKYGLHVFVRSGCMQCHWGPRLTDDAFHVIRMPTGRRDGRADRGRIDGLEAWRASEFRGDGRWSDAPVTRDVADHALVGQERTPPLRGVADGAFFGHGGALGHLSDVTKLYGTGGVPEDDSSSAGEREPWIGRFGETVQWGLVPFLRVLSAPIATR